MEQYLQRVKITLDKNSELKSFKVNNSRDMVEPFREILGRDTIDVYESFVVIFFNQKLQSLGWFKVSQGGIASSIVDVRLLFSAALNCLATGMAVCHNHPTGVLVPSRQDRAITERIQEAGRLLDIRLIDHLIVTSDSYYSFMDEGDLN